jgi:hypothetical protein
VTSAAKAKHPPRGACAAHNLMPLLLDGQRGARGREKSEMDEPRRYLHGTLVGLCRRRSPTAARRGRGERAAAAARVRAPPEWGATRGPREKTVL